MFADIQRLENAARLSMATFQESDAVTPARHATSWIQAIVVITAITAPCIALLMYY